MLVRNATPDDEHSIAELNSAAWRIAFREVVSDEYLATLDGPSLGRREVLESLSENSIQFVAENDESVIGWLAAHPCEDADCDPTTTFEIGACYVAPAYWRRGIGRLLVDALLQHLSSTQWYEIKLWAARDVRTSHAFYRSLGFKEDGQIKDHILSDGNTIPVIRFTRGTST